MATSPQDPGVLSISFQRGEVWSKLIDFSEPATLDGYTGSTITVPTSPYPDS